MYLSQETAPFLILQGGADTKPKINDSRVMEATLRAHGLDVVYVEIPDIDHCSWSWELSGPWMLAFLGQHLHPAL